MMTSGTGLLLTGPLLAALIAWLLSRWQRLTAVSGILALGMLWLLLGGIPSPPAANGTTIFLGQTFELTAGVQGLFRYNYAGLALLFALAALFPPGRQFVPGSLLVMALLAAALMIRPFALGALILVLAMAVVAMIVQEDRAGTIQAALRYLAMAVIAMPFFLIAAWAVETESALLTSTVSRLVMVGGIILLAGFPFHIWATSIMKEASPLVWVLVFGLVQMTLLTFLFRFLAGGAGIAADSQLNQIIRLSGAVTLFLSILLALTAAQIRRLLASLLLLDLAVTVLVLVLPLPLGWQTAVAIQMARFLGLLLIAIGWLLLQMHGAGPFLASNSAGDAGSEDGDLGRRVPMSLTVFIFGCLSLIGLPLSLGFGARWLALRALAQSQLAAGNDTAVTFWLAGLVLLTVAVCTLALLRRCVRFWAAPDEAVEEPLSEAPWLRGVLAVLLVVALWFAFNPQILLALAERFASLFTA